MTDTLRLEQAKKLRKEADRLEAEASRKLPKKWKIGMRVRYLRDKEWAWSRGDQATVVKLDSKFKNKKGDEYQVFWTTPDGWKERGSRFWTTPDDVELVDQDEGGRDL